jgi:hypothetical protein
MYNLNLAHNELMGLPDLAGYAGDVESHNITVITGCSQHAHALETAKVEHSNAAVASQNNF